MRKRTYLRQRQILKCVFWSRTDVHETNDQFLKSLVNSPPKTKHLTHKHQQKQPGMPILMNPITLFTKPLIRPKRTIFPVIHELNQGSHYTQGIGIQQLHTSNINDPSQCPEKIHYFS